MKYLITTLFLFSTVVIFGQTVTYDDIVNSPKRPSKNFTEYIASNGESFKIGQTVTINQPSGNSNTFQYISRQVATQVYTTSTDANNSDNELYKFRIGGTKKAGWEVYMVLKSGDAWRYIVELEQALTYKEIKSSILSREDAIAKLKEAKDLLDLDLMTQEEYDALRKKLTPIIRGNQ